MVHTPILDTVRRVIEHLADDLASCPCISCAFTLDKGRNAVLIKEQMVKAVAATLITATRHCLFPFDEQPAPWGLGIDLITRQEIRVLRNQLLEHSLNLIRLLNHRQQTAPILLLKKDLCIVHYSLTLLCIQ